MQNNSWITISGGGEEKKAKEARIVSYNTVPILILASASTKTTTAGKTATAKVGRVN